jgi:hypothetical protein
VNGNPTPRAVWYDPAEQQTHLFNLLDRFSIWFYNEHARSALGSQLLDQMRQEEQRVRARLDSDFTLAIIGNFKNGKSTLVNALLGAEIVTTNVTPETVTINHIRYGPTLHVEAILADGMRVQLTADDLASERLVPILTNLRGVPATQTGQPHAPHQRKTELRDILAEYFNLSEQRDLCFDLGVEYDDLPGSGVRDKARALVNHMYRHGQLNTLVEACYNLRPHLAPTGQVEQEHTAAEHRLLERLHKLASLRNNVSHLVIEAPIDWLRGITLVDTPGLNDLAGFDDHVRAYLPRADALIFVISAGSPLSETERLFLRRYILQRDFSKVFFVVNRLDDQKTLVQAQRTLEYLQKEIGQMFPQAPVFGVSAYAEFVRQQTGEPGVPPELEFQAEFAEFRASVNDSILLNRDVLQIDRAVRETGSLLDEFETNIERLQQAVATDQERRSIVIKQYEDRTSDLHQRLENRKNQVHARLATMCDEAISWVNGFIDRIENETLPELQHTSLDDIQRFFHFFLSDALREAIILCLEAQRPVVLNILSEIHQTSSDDLAAINHLLEYGGAPESVVRRQLNSLDWANLDGLSGLVDQGLVTVFGFADDLVLPIAGLLAQQKKKTEPERRAMYIAELRKALPTMRMAIVDELQSLYHELAVEICRQIEIANSSDINTALAAIQQAQHHHDAGADQVEAVNEVCQDIRTAIGEARAELNVLQERLWWRNEQERNGDQTQQTGA